jgi:glycerophosphoryl diester phosphodiesterase
MEKKANFLNIGHRGAAAYARENTMESIEKAISLKADMVEIDIRRTADGKLVLFHDRTIKTEWGRRPVSVLSLGDLNRSARSEGYEIPTLAEVIHTFKIPFDIEIKARGFEAELAKLLRKGRVPNGTIVSSFFPWVVSRIKRLDADINTGLIVGQDRLYRMGLSNRPLLKRIVANLVISSMHLQDSIVNARNCDRYSKLGLRVYAWTVDDERRMRELIALGVDGIITIKQDLLYDVCHSMTGSGRPALKKTTRHVPGFTYLAKGNGRE